MSYSNLFALFIQVIVKEINYIAQDGQQQQTKTMNLQRMIPFFLCQNLDMCCNFMLFQDVFCLFS